MSNIKVICDRDDLVAIADAVRSKTGSTSEMNLDGMVSGINSISGGGSAEIPTCTVRFVKGTDSEFSNVVVYTEYVNGEERIVNIDNNAIGVTQDEYVLENVVCGSLIYFNWWYYTNAGEMEIDGGVIPIVNSLNGGGETMLFQAQTEPNSVSVITVSGWSDPFAGGSGL